MKYSPVKCGLTSIICTLLIASLSILLFLNQFHWFQCERIILEPSENNTKSILSFPKLNLSLMLSNQKEELVKKEEEIIIPFNQLQLNTRNQTCWTLAQESTLIANIFLARLKRATLISYTNLEYAKTFCELHPNCSGVSRIINPFSTKRHITFRYYLRTGNKTTVDANATSWIKILCNGTENKTEQKSILTHSPVIGLRNSSTKVNYYHTYFNCSNNYSIPPARFPPNIRFIQIWGERNSGTNYLATLLKMNTKLEVMEKYKHVRPDKYEFIDPEHTLYIHLSKDIFSWLRSMHRKPYHFSLFANFTFDGFLLTPWQAMRLPWTDGAYDNIFQLRATKLKSFLTVQNCLPYTLQLRYQDLNTDPNKILNLISSKFNITLNSDINTKTCFWKHELCMKVDVEDKHKYYLEKQYLKEYSQNAFKIVNHNLDREVESKFGYNYSDIPGFLE